jgi:hypothetical protein
MLARFHMVRADSGADFFVESTDAAAAVLAGGG